MFSRTTLNKIRFAKKSLAFLFFLALLPAADISFASTEDRGGTKEDKTVISGGFERKKSSLLSRFDEEKRGIAGRKKEIEEKLEKTRAEVNRLDGEVSQEQIKFYGYKTALNILKSILLPAPLWISMLADNYSGGIFFFITALNVLLYFYFHEKNIFPKHRKIIIIILGIILFFAFPAFGEEKALENDTFLEKCDAVSAIMRMGELEKTIRILEDKRIKEVEIPDIKTKNSNLKPWKAVAIDTPEYFYTLSALYLENNEKGKAINALKNLFDLHPSSFARAEYKERYNEMLSGIIFFYMEENMVSAVSEAARKTADIITDVPVLLNLSDFLYQKNMHESAGELQKKATALAAAFTQDSLKLADFLIKRQQVEDASRLLEEALPGGHSYARTKPLEDVIGIIQFGLERNLKSVVEKGIQAGIPYCRADVGNALKFAQFLFDNKRVEDTSTALEAAYDSIFSLESPKAIKEGFLEITGFALKNQFFEKAGNATEKFMVALRRLKKDPFTFYVPSPAVLECEKSLPADEEISIPVYFAAVLQREGLLNEAQKYYEMAVSHDLEKIVEGYGYEIQGHLNHFYYLREFLKSKGDEERWKKMEPIYSKVEDAYLKRMEAEANRDMDAFRERENEEIKRLEASLEEGRRKIENAQVELSALSKKNILSFIQIPVFSVFLFLVAAGIAIKAWQEAKDASRFKAFSFSWKYCECAGWFYVFTVIGVPIGIPLILCGQLFGHLAKIRRNTEKIGASPLELGAAS